MRIPGLCALIEVVGCQIIQGGALSHSSSVVGSINKLGNRAISCNSRQEEKDLFLYKGAVHHAFSLFLVNIMFRLIKPTPHADDKNNEQDNKQTTLR